MSPARIELACAGLGDQCLIRSATGTISVGCNAGIRTPISGFRDQRPARLDDIAKEIK